MTKEEEAMLHVFETRVRQLILAYNDLKAENKGLRRSLQEKEEALSGAFAENEELRRDYARLKMAKMMEVGDDDLKNAKTRISHLVSEIDKCIAMLNL